MRILITGAKGQLGRAIARRIAGRGHVLLEMGHADLDITQPACAEQIAAQLPDLVVNAAAMTHVDGCEHDPERAFAVNGDGAGHVARGAQLAGAGLIQISSDYVFSGSTGKPYNEWDPTGPISVYGASKLAGEHAVRLQCGRAYIVRTAWLYGLGGHNFVTKILAWAHERPELSVVDNEVGSPTFCDDLADGLLALVACGKYGVFHLVNEGACSRYAFARAILDAAGRPDYPLRAIDHYPRAAKPPSYAPLNNNAARGLGIRLPTWEAGLAGFFERGGGRG